MKTENEIIDLLAAPIPKATETLNLECRNGQTAKAYKAALAWVLKK